jgi:CRP/FNR family transcriptional regulator, cyclic AMP receptor protein
MARYSGGRRREERVKTFLDHGVAFARRLNSSEKRLARLLLLLAHFGKEGRRKPISIDVSQETLAEMIGTTRSRVSFFMNKFRKLGLISYNGKIEVHNSMLNAVLHDKLEIQSD